MIFNEPNILSVAYYWYSEINQKKLHVALPPIPLKRSILNISSYVCLRSSLPHYEIYPVTPDAKSALRGINLIKIKRCGRAKGRACRDGMNTENSSWGKRHHLQHYFKRHYVSVPDQVLFRDIATFYTQGVYLHTNILHSKCVILHNDDKFVDLKYEVNPEYAHHIKSKIRLSYHLREKEKGSVC